MHSFCLSTSSSTTHFNIWARKLIHPPVYLDSHSIFSTAILIFITVILKNLFLSLFLKLCWRVFPREWLTSIPLVWPYCIPVLLLPLERDSELLRERESVLRLRERRWLDGASFDTERGSTSREGEPSLDKKSIPVQSPVSLGEELQWWPDKVGEQTAIGLMSILKYRNRNFHYDAASGALILLHFLCSSWDVLTLLESASINFNSMGI